MLALFLCMSSCFTESYWFGSYWTRGFSCNKWSRCLCCGASSNQREQRDKSASTLQHRSHQEITGSFWVSADSHCQGELAAVTEVIWLLYIGNFCVWKVWCKIFVERTFLWLVVTTRFFLTMELVPLFIIKEFPLCFIFIFGGTHQRFVYKENFPMYGTCLPVTMNFFP